MRGVFDEPEVERAASRPDTELTLTTTTLLLFFFGLVVLCGVCFGLGYSLGHHASQDPAAAAASSGEAHATASPDSGRSKPSANAQPVPAAHPGTVAASPTGSAASKPETSTNGSVVLASTGSSGTGGSPRTASSPAQPAGVRPAVEETEPIRGAPPSASAVAPALGSQASLMVQIAAVGQVEDADVLTSALRRRGYAVVSRREPLDGLIHVRIGPFKTNEEAEKWRQKLLNDGYNAIVQQ